MILNKKLSQHYSRILELDWSDRLVLFSRLYLPKLLSIFIYPILLMVALIIRVVLISLTPIVKIRFGRLWAFQLGSYGIPMEAYLCKKESGLLPRKSTDIFYHYLQSHYAVALEKKGTPSTTICNQDLDRMIASQVTIWEPAKYLDRLNRMLPGNKDNFIVTSEQPYDQYGLFGQYSQRLVFSKEEEELGLNALREMGLPPDTEFICFHARDGQYLREAYPRRESLYGEWGLFEERNADINNYLPAIDQLTSLGYYAIRMGKIVESPIQTSNPHIIDYASYHHSDFMDLFLSSRCKFFIGLNSGMIHLPAIFRSPIAFVNIYPLSCIEEVGYQDSVFIPKLLYSREKSRLLTFREILGLNLGRYYPRQREFQSVREELGLEVVDNTPDEVTDLTLEMHQRLAGVYEETNEDKELQYQFMSIVHEYPEVIRFEHGLEFSIQIGAKFLRKHSSLLK